MENYKSFKIYYGNHPKSEYSKAALQYLCNRFPKVPLNFLTYYFEFYSGLLVPTFRCVKGMFVENCGKLFVNKQEIQQQIPPHPFVQIISSDECFLDDLRVLKEHSKEREYVKLYSEIVALANSSISNQGSLPNKNIENSNPPNVNTNSSSTDQTPSSVGNDENVECSECFVTKSSKTAISCSGDHCICQDCFRKQARRILNKRVKVLRFVCTGGTEDDPCPEQFDRGDMERCLDDPTLMQQLSALGVFDIVSAPASSPSSAPAPSSVLVPTPTPTSAPTPTPTPVSVPSKPPEPPKPKFNRMSDRELNERGWLCPLRRTLMKHPVQCDDGFTYELEAVRSFYNEFRMSPMTFDDWDAFNYRVDEEVQRGIGEYLILYPEKL